MEDYSQYKEDYDREGFVVVRDFLPPKEFADLTANLQRYIREVVPGLPHHGAFYQDSERPETLKQIQHMAEFDPYFEDIRTHPRWQALARGILGEAVNPQQPEWFNKPPGTDHPTPPHQDNYYFNLKPPNCASIWLALEPIDEENGCLRYIVGSHLRGIRPHDQTTVLGFSQGIADFSDADEAQEVAVSLQPADAVVHHCEAIHRADSNRSTTRHRRAFAIVYEGVSCKVDEEGRGQYKASLQAQHEDMGLGDDE